MKVVQINAVCGKGSTGRICVELNEMLMRSGHEGMILYGNGSSDYPHSKKVTGKWGVKLHGLLSRLFGKNAAYSPFATRRILRFLETYEPDVVHLHNLHGNYVNINPLLRYLAQKDIPTVLTLHDCWFFTGKCTHYTAIGCDRWQTGCHDCPKLKSDIPSWFFDRTAGMWEEKKSLFEAIPRLSVIGVSEWITGEARKSFLSNAKDVRTIHNGIDLEVFRLRSSNVRQKYGIPSGKKVILGVAAGWCFEKGVDVFLALSERLDNEQYQIVLVGTDSGIDSILPENIISIHRTENQRELAELYTAADVFVNPTRQDTYPTVNMEAIACGTPVATFRVGGSPEILDEQTGCIAEPNDVDGLVTAVAQICTRQTVSKEACIRRAAEFEKEKCFKEYLSLYENS